MESDKEQNVCPVIWYPKETASDTPWLSWRIFHVGFAQIEKSRVIEISKSFK